MGFPKRTSLGIISSDVVLAKSLELPGCLIVLPPPGADLMVAADEEDRIDEKEAQEILQP